MKGVRSLRLVGLLTLSIALARTFSSIAALGSDDLRIGQRYEIVGELYAYGVANNLNTRQLSVIGLETLHLSGPEIISKQRFQKEAS